MKPDPALPLSRRVRQVLEAVTRLGQGTVAEVAAAVAGDVSYDATRAALRLLREQELVTHGHDGKRYVYRTAMPKRQLQQGALRHLVTTFFEGSKTSTMAALLDKSDQSLSEEELDRIALLVEEARARARRRQ